MNLERWNMYSHEWKRSKNGQMEQQKAMKHGSRKASSEVLQLRMNTYIYTRTFLDLIYCLLSAQSFFY
jgi:hypothetical protein